jgi:hypothetical protein
MYFSENVWKNCFERVSIIFFVITSGVLETSGHEFPKLSFTYLSNSGSAVHAFLRASLDSFVVQA